MPPLLCIDVALHIRAVLLPSLVNTGGLKLVKGIPLVFGGQDEIMVCAFLQLLSTSCLAKIFKPPLQTGLVDQEAINPLLVVTVCICGGADDQLQGAALAVVAVKRTINRSSDIDKRAFIFIALIIAEFYFFCPLLPTKYDRAQSPYPCPL